jgi:hypothetical protein
VSPSTPGRYDSESRSVEDLLKLLVTSDLFWGVEWYCQ